MGVVTGGVSIWLLLNSGNERTAETQAGHPVGQGGGSQLRTARPGRASRPSSTAAAYGEAVIRGLVERVEREADLGTRLIALNELAALDFRAVGPALAGIADDPALPVRVRRQALLLLADKPGEGIREALVAMLDSEEVSLRLAAVQGLGILGQADGFAALDAAFLVEPSTGVAKAIVQSMARIGTPEAVAALLNHSAPDNLPSDMDRDPILGALAGIANPAAVPALTASLIDAPDIESRRALVSSLARIADPTSFDHFLEIVQTDPDHETRCQAMQGLGVIGDPHALETLRGIGTSTDDPRELSYAWTAIQRIEQPR